MQNKIKIVSVVGARPNFMKVAPIHREFIKHKDRIEHFIVHTGQHYDAKMSDTFFRDLNLPTPHKFLGVGSSSHAVQTAKIMIGFEQVCLEINPDLVIVVGDVNSTIACALTAVKLGVKVAHIEGGLRSFDRDMPEEINRIATDAISNYCFVTEESAIDNLQNENFDMNKVFFVGNTMIDSLVHAKPAIDKSQILTSYNLVPKEFVVATLHRPSNVDNESKLTELFEILIELSESRKVIVPLHPRTQRNLVEYGISNHFHDNPKLILTEPLGYIDFLKLMKESDFVITDSGGIQEETTYLGIPCLTLRTTTERPSTIKMGTNKLIMPNRADINSAISDILINPRSLGSVPALWDGKASQRIAKIILKEIFN